MARPILFACFFPVLLVLNSCDAGQDSENATATVESNSPIIELPTSPLVFCEEVGKRVTSDECDYYGELVKRTKAGVGAFNAPDPMMRGQTVKLQLVIAFAPPEPVDSAAGNAADAAANAAGSAIDMQSNKKGIGSRSGGGAEDPPTRPPSSPEETVDQLPGNTISFAPTVGRFMRAELTGDGFEIERTSQEHQEVLPDSQTTWEWNVKAVKGAVHTLTLKTVVEARDDLGNFTPLRSTVKNQTITVKVGFWDRTMDWFLAAPGWMKAITAILGALAALITALSTLWLASRAFGKKSDAKATPNTP